ncbi:winged helix-turn-helix domain-containing protein [Bdellovibrio sp. HCB337]|uniref:winged helix-turn-helix domain-containing protein n=1 Tax=Bdellovibrio sp. HCB337 TaxID=3394358 RepID=UPI0039A71498
MSSELHLSFNIARLHYQRGSFQKSSELCFAICESSKGSDVKLWLQAARLLFQCHHELMRLGEIDSIYNDLLSVLVNFKEDETQGRGLHLMGMWQLAKGEKITAAALLEKALTHSTQALDHEGVARTLHALAFVATLERNFASAHTLIEKTLVLADEMKLDEVTISCFILKSHIYQEENKFDSCVDLTWKAYELAKRAGYHHLEANILVQMARAYHRQGKNQLAEIYGTLALTGLDKEKFPRLYSAIKTTFPMNEKNLIDSDLIIDSQVLKLKERYKGAVDFKHQHILFELIKAFSKNPGHRFTKEELIEKIWNTPYDSSIHDNVIYVSIKRLRTLLEPDPESPKYILRDRKGYYMPATTTVKFKDAETL